MKNSVEKILLSGEMNDTLINIESGDLDYYSGTWKTSAMFITAAVPSAAFFLYGLGLNSTSLIIGIFCLLSIIKAILFTRYPTRLVINSRFMRSKFIIWILRAMAGVYTLNP
jgi:hypothetical protein